MITNKKLLALSAILITPTPEQLNDISIKLDGIDEALAPFVVALAVEAPTEKPNVDEIKVQIFDDNGKTKNLKPSAEERDKAWNFYQQQINQAKQPESKPTPSSKSQTIEFLRSYKNYVKGDTTRRPESIANELINSGIAKAI